MSILYPIKDEIELTDSYSRYSNQCIADEYKLPWLTLYHLQSDIQVNDEIREKLIEGEYDNCSIESFVSALIELQNTLHEDENESHKS